MPDEDGKSTFSFQLSAESGNVHIVVVINGHVDLDMVVTPTKAAIIAQQIANIAALAEQQMPKMKW